MKNIKSVHHVAIEVSDLQRSVDFYQSLGFTLGQSQEFQDEKIEFLILDHFRLELYEVEDVKNKLNEYKQMHLAFEVESWSEILKWIDEKQLEITDGPYELENGWRTIFVKGLDGEILEFILC